MKAASFALVLIREICVRQLPHPCLSVSIYIQVVKARMNKGFLESVDGHCQRICQHGVGLKHNLPLTG